MIDARHEDLRHNVLHDVTMERLDALAQRLAVVEAEIKQRHSTFSEEAELLELGYQGPWGI